MLHDFYTETNLGPINFFFGIRYKEFENSLKRILEFVITNFRIR